MANNGVRAAKGKANRRKAINHMNATCMNYDTIIFSCSVSSNFQPLASTHSPKCVNFDWHMPHFGTHNFVQTDCEQGKSQSQCRCSRLIHLTLSAFSRAHISPQPTNSPARKSKINKTVSIFGRDLKACAVLSKLLNHSWLSILNIIRRVYVCVVSSVSQCPISCFHCVYATCSTSTHILPTIKWIWRKLFCRWTKKKRKSMRVSIMIVRPTASLWIWESEWFSNLGCVTFLFIWDWSSKIGSDFSWELEFTEYTLIVHRIQTGPLSNCCQHRKNRTISGIQVQLVTLVMGWRARWWSL